MVDPTGAGPLTTDPEDVAEAAGFPPQQDGESPEEYQARVDAAQRQAVAAAEAEADDPDEDEPELFPLGSLEGDDLTPQKMVKRGIATTLKASLTKAAVPLRSGGLFDPDKRGRALVHFLPGPVNNQPVRGDDDSVKSWEITQTLRVIHVEPAGDEAALISSEFQSLMAIDGAAAARLLDELRALAGESLRQ